MHNQYVRNKLSIKLNLIMSQGIKTEGVVDEKVIDKLLKLDSENYYGYDKFGLYEIIWDQPKLFPIALMRLSDDYTCHKSGKSYIILYKNKYEKSLFWSQIIEFNVQEWRDEQLKLVLENKLEK